MDTGTPESPVEVPQRVLGGRYELADPIGRGGSAVVHRARDRRTGRAVAIKLFAPVADGVPGHRREREMRLLSELDHPGLVAVLDAGTDAGADGLERPYLVMQLVEGTTLAAQRQLGALTPARATRLGRELAQALAHVHSHGITHRDVTPANVLLDDTGRARLTDFGIALLVDQTRITATGAVIGTAAYMSPEQVCGDPVGPPTDVYALGLVLLEAVTGRAAYSGTGREVALARLTRPPEIPPGLSGPLARLLPQMTADRPGDRPTAAEVASALDGDGPRTMVAIIPPPRDHEVGARGPRTVVGPPLTAVGTAAAVGTGPSSRYRRRPLVAAAGLLVAAGLVAGAVWSFSGAAPSGGGTALTPVAAPPVGSVLPAPRVAPEPVHATVPEPASVPVARRPAAPAPTPVAVADTPGRAAPPARGAAAARDDERGGPGKGNGKGNGGKGKEKGNGNAGKGDDRDEDD